MILARVRPIAAGLAAALAVLCGLAGCASSSPIPVVERLQPPTEKINTHWVSEGETLYAIAWRYNLDAEQLAQANGLNDSYRIVRGQILRLDLQSALRERRASQRVVASAARSRPAAQSTPLGRSTKTTVAAQRTPVQSAPAVKPAAAVAWRWPAEGKLLKRFSAAARNGHKGLDIGGATGQPVLAAQNGVVVYAGAGLPAYGNLLIVKHRDAYLSAYAHNSRLMVREGDTVRAGQQVAELGRSGTSHEHLHFEIRKRGEPVNPLAILPRSMRTGNAVAVR